MAMNVALNSLASISCSSSDTNAIITLLVTGVTLEPNDVVINGLKTTSALFNATANLNMTTMRCSVSNGTDFEGSTSVILLIQGEYTYMSLYMFCIVATDGDH